MPRPQAKDTSYFWAGDMADRCMTLLCHMRRLPQPMYWARACDGLSDKECKQLEGLRGLVVQAIEGNLQPEPPKDCSAAQTLGTDRAGNCNDSIQVWGHP
eukprot:6496059-Alexandrium_andersonii.AAC.1